MTVHIKYFGLLKELLNCEEETMTLKKGCSLALFSEQLIKKHPSLAKINFVTSINHQVIQDPKTLIQNQDKLLLFPPFSGG